jgi:hypothetical protein
MNTSNLNPSNNSINIYDESGLVHGPFSVRNFSLNLHNSFFNRSTLSTGYLTVEVDNFFNEIEELVPNVETMSRQKYKIVLRVNEAEIISVDDAKVTSLQWTELNTFEFTWIFLNSRNTPLNSTMSPERLFDFSYEHMHNGDWTGYDDYNMTQKSVKDWRRFGF